MATDLHPTKLTSLVRKLATATPPELPEQDDPIAVLVFSYLLWEASTEQACEAYGRLLEEIVDFNHLRVCLAHEVVAAIGQRYPRALERCQRLRATLNDIYRREHAVTLTSLESMGKRDIRAYVESLDGIVPFVAARLMMVGFDVHAVPVDDQLRALLIEAKVAADTVEVPELASWITRQVRAGEGLKVHERFQSHVDEAWVAAARATKRKRTVKKSSAPKASSTSSKAPTKKTTKKTTTKKTTTKKPASKVAKKTTKKTTRKTSRKS